VSYAETFKKEYKDLIGRCFFSTWRKLERGLPPRALFSLSKPFFFSRAVANCAFRKRAYATPRPDFLRVPDPARTELRQRMSDYLNHVLEFFPDRLSGEKWIQNCRVEGLEHFQSAARKKRPAILAFSHFGPFFLLRFWLRAHGIPAATLLGGDPEGRGPLMRLKDTFSPFPGVPIAFYSDQLRAADEFIAGGNPLLIPIDAPGHKQIIVPFSTGWTFQMAAGAVRLAIRHHAALIPCTIVDEGRWHFSIKLGEPVPQELLLSKNDWLPAGKHLKDQMVPIFRARPEQCRPDFIRCLKQNAECPS